MAVNSFNAQNPPVNTKGDLFTFSTIPTKLGVGANNTVLTADSSTATGLKWAAAASGQLTISEIATGSVTSGTSLSLTSLSNYDTLKFRINNITTSASSQFSFRINSSSSAVYDYVLWGPTTNNSSAYDGDAIQQRVKDDSNTSVLLHPGNYSKLSSNTDNIFAIDFYNCKASGFTTYEIQAFYAPDFGSTWRQFVLGRGIFKTAATVSSIQFNTTSAFTAGSYTLWGG